MFHNTTTIWHHQVPQVHFKEKRLAFGVFGSIVNAFKPSNIKSAYTKSVGGIGTLWRFGKKITYPFRLPLILSWKGLKKGAGAGLWAMEKGEWGARWGKEVALGGAKDAVGGSIWELIKAPLMFAKRNLVDNTRDIMKGVFTTPLNVLRIPKNLWQGFKESVTETRGHVKATVDSAKDINYLTPFRVANNTRKAVWSLFKTPFKTLWKPTAAVMETPGKVAKNIGLSVAEYPYRVYKSPTHIRSGVSRVLNAHKTASAEMAARHKKAA